MAGPDRAPVQGAAPARESSSSSSGGGGRKLEAEALGVGDGRQQAVAHLAAARVVGEQQHVEARVRRGQLDAVRALALDREAQLGQTPDRRPVAARDELEELPLRGLVPLLEHLPEPLDGLRLGRVAALVLSHALQRLEVEHGRPHHKHLQLARREQPQQPRRVEHHKEPVAEGLELRRHRPVKHPVDEAVHVLAPVRRRHRLAPSPRLQLLGAGGAEAVVDRLEVEAEHVLHLAGALEVQQRRQPALRVRAEVGKVGEGEGPAEQLLVERVGECQVQQHPVVHRQPQQHPHQLELRGLLQRRWVEPPHPRLLLEDEHAELRVEEPLDDQREELLSQPPGIHPLLTDEEDAEGLEEVRQRLPRDLRQSVLHQEVPPQPHHAVRGVRRGDARVHRR
eukprot:CAMPEP_0113724022 /NCGR_PEP_ID=MMETSP0038_2-20120614/38808_1 /TAXON_ID=2898 /ORGANISM="Cryptomonas paramecium" /LENGTH=394 /DNA_ID=CAMNT_0000653797 /DNA_START=133 /DNA_END=1315 /DNA_ORIENTATION=+ /assembly_acc=CAM_ASM_000170